MTPSGLAARRADAHCTTRSRIVARQRASAPCAVRWRDGGSGAGMMPSSVTSAAASSIAAIDGLATAGGLRSAAEAGIAAARAASRAAAAAIIVAAASVTGTPYATAHGGVPVPSDSTAAADRGDLAGCTASGGVPHCATWRDGLRKDWRARAAASARIAAVCCLVLSTSHWRARRR